MAVYELVIAINKTADKLRHPRMALSSYRVDPFYSSKYIHDIDIFYEDSKIMSV